MVAGMQPGGGRNGMIDPTSTSQGISFSGSTSLESGYVVDGISAKPADSPAEPAPIVAGEYTKNIPMPGRTFEGTLGRAAGSQGDAFGVGFGSGSGGQPTATPNPAIAVRTNFNPL